MKLPYLTALFLATIIGVFFNYFSIARLVFLSRGGVAVSAKFLISYIIIYVLNALALNMLIANLQLGAYMAQAFIIPWSVLLSWMLMNYWVFKKK